MKCRARGSPWRLSPALVGLAITVALRAPPLAAPITGAEEDKQQKGIALVARAQSLEKLLASDTGPFHLRAHVTLFGMVGGTGTLEGEYLLFAVSSGRWFEQIRFPGYSELSGLYDGERWRKRNVVEKPFRLHEVAQTLSPAYHLELPGGAQIGELRQKEVAGTKAICIEASPTAALWQSDRAGMAAISPVGISRDSRVTLCFEANSGLLRSATYKTDLPRFEYEGQVTSGNKVFPKVLRCYEGKDLVVEATVEEDPTRLSQVCVQRLWADQGPNHQRDLSRLPVPIRPRRADAAPRAAAGREKPGSTAGSASNARRSDGRRPSSSPQVRTRFPLCAD